MGFPRARFLDWFKSRRIKPSVTVPHNVREFFSVLDSGMLWPTKDITVRFRNNNPYPEVVGSTVDM